MDPDQPKTPDQNLPVPEASNPNSYMDNVNKPQTPAFNNTEYWNNKTEDTENKMTEPVNAPEPISSPEPATPVASEPIEPFSQTPAETVTPNSDPTYTKWDDPPGEPSTPTSAPTSSNTLKIVIAIVGVLLLGAAGIFAFRAYQSKYQQAYTPLPTPTLEAMATPDPYANWRTYTSDQFGISMRYPAELTYVYDNLKDIVTNKTSGNLLIQNYDGLKTVPVDNTTYQLSLMVTPVTTAGLKDYATKQLSSKETQLEEVTINGVTGFKSTLASKGIEVPTVWLDGKTYFYRIQLTTPTSTYAAWFDQIVSTFKLAGFASPSPSASPSGSPVSTTSCEKGYKALSKDGYSLCYPESLKQTSAETSSNTVVLEDATQTLKVMQNFQGGWGGSPCLFIDATTVAGYKSKRLSWKTEQATGGGCDNTFTSFAEMINEGNFKFPFPYALELTSKKTPFQDNSVFLTIEKSFQVTNSN